MSESERAYHRELAGANKVIRDAGALRVEDDGFQWVDESLLCPGFNAYYRGLVSAGYAMGHL